jgi:hypothetical protein
MKTMSPVGLTCLFACIVWCSNAGAVPAASPVEKLVDDFVFDSLALSPAGATGVGYHRHHGVVLDDLPRWP